MIWCQNGHTNPDGQRHCGQCGAALAIPSPSPSAQPQQQWPPGPPPSGIPLLSGGTPRGIPRWIWIAAAAFFIVGVVVASAATWAITSRDSATSRPETGGPWISPSGSLTPTTPVAPPAPIATPAPPSTSQLPQVVAEPNTGCGPDQATAVRSALSQVPAPQIAATTGAEWSAQIWAPNSNYDACADLSTVVITVEGATGSSPEQALMFHRGSYLGTGTLKDYAFVSLDKAASTKDTVVLSYRSGQSCTACGDGVVNTVRYHWDGTRVQMLDPPPPG
jgi:hypothetical protein